MLLQTAVAHYIRPNQNYIVRTKHLTLWDDIRVFIMVKSGKEYTNSLVEESLLEAISDVSWERQSLDEDFSYVTEKYNKFTHTLKNTDEMSVFFWVNIDEIFMFSVIGDISMVMKEGGKKWSIVSDVGQANTTEFSYISSGKIPQNSVIYIGSTNILDALWSDTIDDLSLLDESNFEETVKWLLERESIGSTDIIRIDRPGEASKIRLSELSWVKSTQRSIMSGLDELSIKEKVISITRRLDVFFHSRPKAIQRGIILWGVFLCFMLLYVLFYEIFNLSSQGPATDSKQQLIQAKEYLDIAEKNLSNSAIFSQNIKSAESILFALRDDDVYAKDTQDMLSKISTLRKELYDIETFEMNEKASIIPFSTEEIAPIKIFESSKKLNLIGKNGAILDYIVEGWAPKITAYPIGEEAIDADINADGSLFVLTKSKKMLSRKQNQFVPVPVGRDELWEEWSRVRSYNGNLYIVSSEWNQVFKHKPGANAFGPSATVLTGYTGGSIIDIGIDGGFYVLENSGKIHRIITAPAYTETSITLNGIPWDYALSNNPNVMIYVKQNLSYIYMLNGDNIWIFEPDSKNYKDVRSWKYIAQIEVTGKDDIRSISVPYDGKIYVVWNTGVYAIRFEVTDSKIILQ